MREGRRSGALQDEGYFGKGGLERAIGIIIINGVKDESRERNIFGRERELQGRRNGEIHWRKER